MTVESFDPGAIARFRITDAVLARLLEAAAAGAPGFGLAAQEVTSLSPAATSDAWPDVFESLDAEQLVALARLFTLAETELAGWQAGAKSPVIAIVAHLRATQQCPADLIGWIKANTDNRFLPYGNLMDRL